MSSRAELDKIFPSLVKKYTDRRGYTDWYSLVEDLQLKEITTFRNRQWKWRNAESWWLRNRRRIKEGRVRAKFHNRVDAEHNETAHSGEPQDVMMPAKSKILETQETVTLTQVTLDFS